MTPLAWIGCDAYSAFRMAALVERIRRECPALAFERVYAAHVYFADAEAEPDAETLSRVEALLGAKGRAAPRFDAGFVVAPRRGTISPWSSKATDIFRNCGVGAVRRVERGTHYVLHAPDGAPLSAEACRPAWRLLHDRMTQAVYTDLTDLFAHAAAAPSRVIDIRAGGAAALREANVRIGLALSDGEIDYLYAAFRAADRNPTDSELVMFGQVNSEHCRHKIFRGDWIIDGVRMERSLFDMIRHTHACHPQGTLVAYEDNSGVIEGFAEEWFEASAEAATAGRYGYARKALVDILAKVETHNHPTAICPYPGAATGVGGEIRDEAATGIGGRSRAGLCGFMVSNLRIPGFIMPWEKDYAEFPARLATPLGIMLEGPIGGANFGNEFGRPQLCGLFRTFEETYNGRYRGYHKPIMLAGGMGNIKRRHVRKADVAAGAAIVQIGGPALRIGLGGGAASSMDTGSNAEHLDYDSVQRDNAEMQRRCQQAIDACIALGAQNPILSIHDIGAGGLSNGCPELVAHCGGKFRLRAIPNEEPSMSPMEIWCCEAQERYVLAVNPRALDRFLALCARERCPVAVIGEATGDGRLSLFDEKLGDYPIDIGIDVILGKPPKMLRDVARLETPHAVFDATGVSIADAAERVLRLPAVAAKTFLITIADRSVTGMVARDQMVGPYQTPVADAAVTAVSYRGVSGEAMSMGERTAAALVSAPASGRMAVGEALTNIASADVGAIGNVKLSANWMCACGEPGEDANLYDTVKAVGMELCPALGVAIPVGKDSLSMRTVWQTSAGASCRMVAPLSLIVSAFAPVSDVRRTVTPDLKPAAGSSLVLVDLGRGRNRLGASALARVYNQVGGAPPDLDRPADMAGFFAAVQELVAAGRLLAYHDRSDGGLFVTLLEMAFAGRRGFTADIGGLGADALAALFAEELGAVLQVAEENTADALAVLARHGLADAAHVLGSPADDRTVRFTRAGATVYEAPLMALHRAWSELTYRMQALRDNPECARQEYDNLLDAHDPGMTFRFAFKPARPPRTPRMRPKIAVLREQGVNGHVEMAAAFDAAGFAAYDVHMTDLLAGRVSLDGFRGLVACGGFSYGDVLGSGSGWAKSILYNPRLKQDFARFLARPDTFALGVCNGCQMMSQLKGIIPGAADWPAFSRNLSEVFEARYVTVEILPSPSVFFRGMEGSRLGVAVAHGEGRADFGATGSAAGMTAAGLVCARYVDNTGRPTERYPLNPNGSPMGMTGFTTPDGRVTIMMPHPERGFRALQASYRPAQWRRQQGWWLQMFVNARKFVG